MHQAENGHQAKDGPILGIPGSGTHCCCFVANVDCMQAISSWTYRELQRFCVAHELVAIGTTADLRGLVNRWFCEGAVVDVVFDDDPMQPRKIRRGIIKHMRLDE